MLGSARDVRAWNAHIFCRFNPAHMKFGVNFLMTRREILKMLFLL